MTDAERLEEIRAKLEGGSLSRHEAADLIRADRQWSKDRIVELEAEVERLRKAIQTVLDDNETGAGGWGPDVTMAEVLRVAIEGES